MYWNLGKASGNVNNVVRRTYHLTFTKLPDDTKRQYYSRFIAMPLGIRRWAFRGTEESFLEVSFYLLE